MITRYATRRCLLVTMSFCWGLFWCQPAASGGPTNGPTAKAGSNAVLNLTRLKGDFTVTAFQVVNGVSEAVGMVTAEATDSTGASVDIFTNIPVRLPMPLNGPLTGKASLLSSVSKEYVPPPTLSTNLCTILAISIEFIDVTIPGLGLNVHVNQLLLGVRADRETRLGDVLCTLLGEDIGAKTILGSLAPLKIRLDGNRVLVEGTNAAAATLQSAPALNQPIPWTDVATPTGAVQVILAPTGTAQFFKLNPK
jgi:hypothetical protein